MKLRIRLLACIALVAPLLVALATTPSAAGPGDFCPPKAGLTANVWIGLGINANKTDDWDSAANWSLGHYPNDRPAHPDPYVCVPSGGVPMIPSGSEERLVLIDVEAGATVYVGTPSSTGAKLFLYGDQGTQPSWIRGTVEVNASTLGGDGKINVSGKVVMAPTPSFASALFTRECSEQGGGNFPFPPGEEPCVAGVPISGPKGLMNVTDTGQVDVVDGGINYGDEYQMVVRGRLRMVGDGYIAANRGTGIELRPHTSALPGTGTLLFQGDGNIFEGFAPLPALATFKNLGGLIRKSAGSGTSLVYATYTQNASAEVEVDSGTLALPTGVTTAATVLPKGSFGSGSCPPANPAPPTCDLSASSSDTQNAQLRVPASADPGGVGVTVLELTSGGGANQVGKPIRAHADATATATDPFVLTLRYDSSIRNGRVEDTLKIFRDPDVGATYQIPKCIGAGQFPLNQTSCVDRRNSKSTDLPDGDIRIVVRTTVTSRWIAR